MSTSKPVAVIVGATSKWQADGRNTKLVHGGDIDDSNVPIGARWGVGGAVAQKFASEEFFVVLTTRKSSNAAALSNAIEAQGGECMTVATADEAIDVRLVAAAGRVVSAPTVLRSGQRLHNG